MTLPATSPVQTSDVDGVLVVTIDRPHVANAIDPHTARAIAAAMDELDADDGLHVGVITGSGGRFSAGMDLAHVDRTGERPIVPGRGFAGIVERPANKPLIAAVEGPAVGGGCEIALACDLIIAAETASFGLPEVRVGLLPGGGGLFRLARQIPPRVAAEMVLSGEPIGAARALDVGLVNRVVPTGRALEVALAVAEVIASNAPLAVRSALTMLRTDDADGWEKQQPLIDIVRASEDAVEGPRAFTQKRAPVWKGK